MPGDCREIGSPNFTGDMASAFRHSPVCNEDFNKDYFMAVKSNRTVSKNNDVDTLIDFDEHEALWDWYSKEALKIYPVLQPDSNPINPKALDHPR